MPYEIDLLENNNNLHLKRQVFTGDYSPTNLIPNQSPTLKQLATGAFLTTPVPGPLTETMLQDIQRRGEVSIYNDYIVTGEDLTLDDIEKSLLSDLTPLKRVILDFVKLELVTQHIILFAAKETLCERILLNKLNWLPRNIDNVSSTLEIRIINFNTFEIYFMNGIALLDASNPFGSPKILGVFEQTLQLSLAASSLSMSRNYINWPKQALQHCLYVNQLNARYVFSEEIQRCAATALGYSTRIIKDSEHPLYQTWQDRNLVQSPCRSPYGEAKEPSKDVRISPRKAERTPSKPLEGLSGYPVQRSLESEF